MQWIVNYDQILPLLNTGDIIFFSGEGVGSQLVKVFSNSRWSHVGLVYRDGKKLYTWEGDVLINGTPSSLGVEFTGVSMIEFEERIKGYYGEIAVRRLINLSKKEAEENQVILSKFKEEINNRPFEKLDIELVRAAYDGPFGKNVKNLSRIFCSELVAEAYQRLGLLPAPPIGLPSNEYIPGDFDRNSFSLIKGVLADMVQFKFKIRNTTRNPLTNR